MVKTYKYKKHLKSSMNNVREASTNNDNNVRFCDSCDKNVTEPNWARHIKII